MPSRDWRTFALSLVEQAAAAESRDELLRDLFATLDRELGVDSGSLASLEHDGFVTWNKPEACARLWRERRQHYLRECMPLIAMAEGQGGVVHANDALTIHQRSRSAFYAEYMRVLGANTFAGVLVRGGGS